MFCARVYFVFFHVLSHWLLLALERTQQQFFLRAVFVLYIFSHYFARTCTVLHQKQVLWVCGLLAGGDAGCVCAEQVTKDKKVLLLFGSVRCGK